MGDFINVNDAIFHLLVVDHSPVQSIPDGLVLWLDWLELLQIEESEPGQDRCL